jgi:hypothetical protein
MIPPDKRLQKGSPRTKAISKKGSEASVRVRRQRKELKEVANAWLDQALQKGSPIRQQLEKLAGEGVTITTGGDALIGSQFLRATIYLDTRAAEFIRDTAGQAPVPPSPTVDNPILAEFAKVFAEASRTPPSEDEEPFEV